jgi:hypothetical protein
MEAHTMHTVTELIEQIRLLPSQDRQQFLKELQALMKEERRKEQDASRGPYTHSLALAGTVHTTHPDISADKYKHLVEAYADCPHSF